MGLLTALAAGFAGPFGIVGKVPRATSLGLVGLFSGYLLRTLTRLLLLLPARLADVAGPSLVRTARLL